MIRSNVINFLFIFICFNSIAQTVSGHMSLLAHEVIRLEGFNGLTTYEIATTKADEKGYFKLEYSKLDYGVGYLQSVHDKPLFVILNGEDIEFVGKSFSYIETIKAIKGKENQYFETYAKEHPQREQVLSAWIYLERFYSKDSLFSKHKKIVKSIFKEKKRIKDEDASYLAKLPENSYVQWFLPVRKLVSSVSIVAQYRSDEIPETIAALRALDYADIRLYKSGLYKDAIENHFWLLENSGKSLKDGYIEMQHSIDAMMNHLVKDQKIFNEATTYLFELLERRSLFQASEYLAIKVLNDKGCTINSNLARQLESYRAMKKGNTAPDIYFGENSYLKGIKQNHHKQLSNIDTPYTVVVFGASWCPKCVEDLPKLINSYPKWKTLGVEVVYVSLDTDQLDFNRAVTSYPFYTYCDFNKWDSQVVNDYYVFATPTFFLLNNKQEIVLKPTSVEQINSWVDWFLIEGNK